MQILKILCVLSKFSKFYVCCANFQNIVCVAQILKILCVAQILKILCVLCKFSKYCVCCANSQNIMYVVQILKILCVFCANSQNIMCVVQILIVCVVQRDWLSELPEPPCFSKSQRRGRKFLRPDCKLQNSAKQCNDTVRAEKFPNSPFCWSGAAPHSPVNAFPSHRRRGRREGGVRSSSSCRNWVPAESWPALLSSCVSAQRELLPAVRDSTFVLCVFWWRSPLLWLRVASWRPLVQLIAASPTYWSGSVRPGQLPCSEAEP